MFAYRFSDANVNFDLTGAVIPIEGIKKIQTAKLPLGGSLSFQLHGSGPLLAPLTQGTVRHRGFSCWNNCWEALTESLMRWKAIARGFELGDVYGSSARGMWSWLFFRESARVW